MPSRKATSIGRPNKAAGLVAREERVAGHLEQAAKALDGHHVGGDPECRVHGDGVARHHRQRFAVLGADLEIALPAERGDQGLDEGLVLDAGVADDLGGQVVAGAVHVTPGRRLMSGRRPGGIRRAGGAAPKVRPGGVAHRWHHAAALVAFVRRIDQQRLRWATAGMRADEGDGAGDVAGEFGRRQRREVAVGARRIRRFFPRHRGPPPPPGVPAYMGDRHHLAAAGRQPAPVGGDLAVEGGELSAPAGLRPAM